MEAIKPFHSTANLNLIRYKLLAVKLTTRNPGVSNICSPLRPGKGCGLKVVSKLVHTTSETWSKGAGLTLAEYSSCNLIQYFHIVLHSLLSMGNTLVGLWASGESFSLVWDCPTCIYHISINQWWHTPWGASPCPPYDANPWSSSAQLSMQAPSHASWQNSDGIPLASSTWDCLLQKQSSDQGRLPNSVPCDHIARPCSQTVQVIGHESASWCNHRFDIRSHNFA